MAGIASGPDLLGSTRSAQEPWKELSPEDPPRGYASFYYADELASLPVRAITRVKDNKSDPNIETGTYGLFSTCQQRMRAGVVSGRPRYIFFFARPRKAGRHLTGVYELGWWAPGSLSNRVRDFALAASRVRFVDPIPIEDLPSAAAERLRTVSWRLDLKLDEEETAALLDVVSSSPDRTADYVREVDRMERVNRYHSGYRYPTWQRRGPWSWQDATRYLEPAETAAGEKVPNLSPTGWWGCGACDGAIENRSLLKACPECGKPGTLRPLTESEVGRVVHA